MRIGTALSGCHSLVTTANRWVQEKNKSKNRALDDSEIEFCNACMFMYSMCRYICVRYLNVCVCMF